MNSYNGVMVKSKGLNTFKKTQRVVKNDAFSLVFRQGSSVKNPRFTFYYISNSVDHPRLGLPIGKSFGNSPDRNRVKRRIRELFRLNRKQLPAVDLLVIPRDKQTFARMDFQSLTDSFLSLASSLAQDLSKN